MSQGFQETTDFAHAMRKHLKGRKIISIEQHKFDRIIVVGIGERILAAEMFHKGNVILCDGSMKILVAMRPKHWKDRSIVTGERYEFPAGVDITSSEEFFPALETGEKIVSFLVKGGLGSHAEGLLERCGIEKLKECRSLSAEERKSIFSEIMSLLKKEAPGSVSEAVSASLRGEEFTVADKRDAAVKKMRLKEAELRSKAEKIYERFSEISGMLEKTKDRHPVIEIDGMKIEINRSVSLEKNAEKYFGDSKKVRGKIGRASGIVVKEKPKARPERKEWYHKFRHFYTSDRFLVIAGKDAKTNSDLVKKRMESRDIAIHAEVHGAAFAVVKCDREITRHALEEAMQFAACHSKAWAMGIGAVDVYWVKPEQLKNAVGMGTFSVIGEKNYMRRMELKLAAGFVNGELCILPHRFFEHTGGKCVPIFTGDTDAKSIAKRVKEELKKLHIDMAREIDGIPLDVIASKIPYGRGSV